MVEDEGWPRTVYDGLSPLHLPPPGSMIQPEQEFIMLQEERRNTGTTDHEDGSLLCHAIGRSTTTWSWKSAHSHAALGSRLLMSFHISTVEAWLLQQNHF